MSLNPELKSINCTSCGAGLDILGGGRVTTHICSYCGSELDTQDNYKVLAKFDQAARPKSPFWIGMVGHLYDVEWTIIGTLQHEERWAGKSWTWIDHQLFSPTHGYAWLTIEDGHLTFSRRDRKAVAWMSERQVETAHYQPRVRLPGEVFKYYDTSSSQVIFAEGEFTWAPKTGEVTTTVSALSDGAMLGFSSKGQERETYRTVYLPKAEAEAGFDIKTGLRPRGVHPTQALKAGEHSLFLLKSGLFLAVLCILLGGFLSSLGGKAAMLPQSFAVHDLPVSIPFEVKEPGRLTRVQLRGDARNSWGYFAVELEDPEGELLFESGRTIEYYFGGDWSEGSNRAELNFFPPVGGTYTLSIELEESGFWAQGFAPGQAIKGLEVKVTNGVSSGFWLAVLGLVFGVIGGLPLLRRYLHHKRRWSGSDWSDED